MAPRLLWITQHYHPGRGGMAVACDRIVYGLRRAGVTVDLVHVHDGAGSLRVERRLGGRDFDVPLDADLAHTANILWAQLERDPARPGSAEDSPQDPLPAWTHVVAFGGTFPLVAAPVYAAWLRLPLVVLLRGNDFDLGTFTPGRSGMLEDAIARAGRVCCVTRTQAARVAALHPEAEVTCVPNGIDLEEWRALPSDLREAQRLRSHLSVSHGSGRRKVLGLFGNLKAKKGLPFLIGRIAAAGVASRLHLMLVGEAEPGIPEALAEVPDLLSTLLPPVARSALIPYALACDAVALPSFYDGFPNVLLETAALGVPLLVSAAGGAGELNDGEQGMVFPTGDGEACGDALRRLVAADAETLARWGSAAQQFAGRFSAAAETEAYGKVFDATAQPAADTAQVARFPLRHRQ